MKTIKTLLLLFCIIMVTATLNAQRKTGIRAGWNSATVSDSDFDVSPRSGFYLGVSRELNLLPKILYIVPEIQYSSQGFKSNNTDYSIDYLNVPVLGKVYFLKILSFELGPQFGFKVSDNLDSAMGDVETFDIQGAAGFGINLPFGLSIETRYVQGFNEIVKDSGVKNQVIQVGAGFKF